MLIQKNLLKEDNKNQKEEDNKEEMQLKNIEVLEAEDKVVITTENKITENKILRRKKVMQIQKLNHNNALPSILRAKMQLRNFKRH